MQITVVMLGSDWEYLIFYAQFLIYETDLIIGTDQCGILGGLFVMVVDIIISLP